MKNDPKYNKWPFWSYCEDCIYLREDSLSCEEYGYYNSCGNSESENYYGREDDLSILYPGEKCPDKEIE